VINQPFFQKKCIFAEPLKRAIITIGWVPRSWWQRRLRPAKNLFTLIGSKNWLIMPTTAKDFVASVNRLRVSATESLHWLYLFRNKV